MRSFYCYIIAALLAVTLLPSILHAQLRDDDDKGRESASPEAAILYAQRMIYGYQTEGENETPKSRELYFYGLRAYPFGKIPQYARQNALGQMEKMATYGDGNSLLASDAWEQIGPFDVGGRVNSIVVHPTDGNIVWIGTADGGVWKSTDAGSSWAPKMDNTNAIAMGALAVDPSNPSLLYAGTGEMTSNVDAYNGAGIFKSEDGGETWHVLALTNVGAFSRIVVHPTNGNIIWAGATKNNGGFYKSIDGGITWRRVLETPIADITVNPQNPNQLWIGMMSGGIRESTDGGETFTTRNTGLGTSGVTLNRISLQVAPSNPSILFALSYESAGTSTSFSRIYKSTNSGRNWSKVFDTSPDFLGNGLQSQGWYNNVLAIKPDDPNIVVAGGVSMMRTSNGGTSWNSAGGNVHPDHHAMAFDPTNPSRLYEGNDGGMYLSQNAGTSFAKISNGLAISQFYDLAVDQREDHLTYGGTQDNGTLTQSSTQYGDVYGGDGFYVQVDHTDPSIIYIERENGQMYRLDNSGGTSMFDQLPTSAQFVNWSAPLALDPRDPNKLYSGRHKLYVCFNPRSDRSSISWFQVSPEMAGNISAIGISPLNSDVIFIGSAQGMVMRTTNATDEWTDLTFGHGLPNRAVTDFAFSKTDPNIIYVSYSGFFAEHVYKTTDGGDTWFSVGHGLPDIPVNALAIHPDDENILFAGTDIGMFISLDGGATWTVYNNGMPRVSVIDLEVHESSRTLRAATHGRSMFQIDIGGEGPSIQPSITSPAGGEVWIGTTSNVIAWGGFNDPQGVLLEYSLDDGQTWRTLGEHISSNAFRWNTVNKNSIVARVRVTGMSNKSQSALSNTFTITQFGQGAVLVTDSKPTVPYGITFDGEFLWTSDFNSNKLLKIDPISLNVIEEVLIKGNAADKLDSLFTDLTYFPPRNSFFIHKLDRTTPPLTGGVLMEVTKNGNVTSLFRSRCTYPIGLTWLGGKNPDFPFLVASDRDASQLMYFYDPDNVEVEVFTYQRATIVESGPRCLAADSGGLWQVMTDFTGGVLQSARVQSFNIDDDQLAQPVCEVPLNSPLSASINARGVELDDKDKGIWITDFGGNIYKIATCYTLPGISDSGYVGVSAVAGVTMPEGVSLGTNRPNPFSTTTEINFTLPSPMQAKVLVHDMNGKLIATLADKEFEAGTNRVEFNPKGLPSGTYRYSLVLENGTYLSKMMVYLK